MATAEQVAKSSLDWILVNDAQAPLSVNDINDFIFSMNNYMLALDAEGVTLGYTIIENSGDQVTVPGGTLRGLIANMALERSTAYDATVTPELVEIAKNGLKQMRLVGQSIAETRYPSTLPIGSGNETDSGYLLTSHFYPEEEARILAESTGYISLENNTNQVIHDES